ncbi:hypothetical protein [Alkalisalibacterium limincola]|uniref:Uncharacterized protein n=1 Tax=Alkalisalibacterium limincola TaxID=2699169 RepID=A0A5C8L177_9GAMM|nr:hypothetical protein [Alkalisalibacterium limincola]TXK65903.1 hypothetical protein FU658_02160 [Alkalisalibacterium limincola]
MDNPSPIVNTPGELFFSFLLLFYPDPPTGQGQARESEGRAPPLTKHRFVVARSARALARAGNPELAANEKRRPKAAF